MKKLLHYALILALLCGITNTQAKNLKIHVSTAGTLSTVLGNTSFDPSITQLTITGNLNEKDFEYLLFKGKRVSILDLSEVSVPNDKLPSYAFMGYHPGFGELILPKNLKTIGGGAFESTHISEPLILPMGLEVIEGGAFQDAKGNIQIDFSKCKKSLKKLGWMAFGSDPIFVNNGYFDFSDFTNLTEIGDLGMIGRKVVLPNNMASVPIRIAMQYDGCVELSDKTTYIGDYAFYNYSGAAKEIIVRATTPPKLGKDVFSSNVYKYTTLRVPKEFINLYKKTDGWKDFLNILPLSNTPQKISLHYTEDNGKSILGVYEGVKIGEYYWMNSPFRDDLFQNQAIMSENDKGKYHLWNANKEVKKSQIEEWHQHARMFKYATTDKSDYWEQIQGQNIQEKIDNIDKFYGTYQPRLAIDFMYWYSNKTRGGEYIYLLEGEDKQKRGWDLPSQRDVLQLIGMCGNGTIDEVRTTLSPSYRTDKDNFPVVIQPRTYYGWTDGTIHANNQRDEADPNIHINGKVIDSQINKYGFNLFGSGARYNGVIQDILEFEDGDEIWMSKIGDFHGFDQAFFMPLHNNKVFKIHDFLEFENGKSEHWMPIRWMRALTDEELGYKLYINIEQFKEKDENYEYAVELYNNHINGVKYINIRRTTLNENPGEGWSELPKGLLRGFYVQHMLENPISYRSMADFLKYYKRYWRLFSNNFVKNETETSRAALATDAPSAIETGFEDKQVNVYPNPVIDVLNINGYNEVIGLQLYNSAGNLVVKQDFANQTLDISHLSEGVYIIKLQTKQGTFTQKIIKR